MEKTGLGHQYKEKERMLNACIKSLNEADEHLRKADLTDVELWKIKWSIIKLANKCLELSYSANEAFKQNQS